jgi:hypothetical protein
MSLAELKPGDALDGRKFGEYETVVVDGRVVRLTIVLQQVELGPADEIKKALDAETN